MKISGIIKGSLPSINDYIIVEVESTPRYSDDLNPHHIYEVYIPASVDDERLGLVLSPGNKFSIDEDDEVWVEETKIGLRLKEELEL